VTIVFPDGSVEVREGGSRAWRNNNPSNIQAGKKAHEYGAIGGDGEMAIFPDEGTGQAALRKHLDEPFYAGLTIDAAIAKRTPSADPRNDTARTQELVRRFSGLAGDAVIGNLTPDAKERLYDAIRRAEGWAVGRARRTPTTGVAS
jgi:hypothetical protein